jgi:hypothetical protein
MTREELIADIIKGLTDIDYKLADLLTVPSNTEGCEDIALLLADLQGDLTIVIYRATQKMKEVQP